MHTTKCWIVKVCFGNLFILCRQSDFMQVGGFYSIWHYIELLLSSLYEMTEVGCRYQWYSSIISRELCSPWRHTLSTIRRSEWSTHQPSLVSGILDHLHLQYSPIIRRNYIHPHTYTHVATTNTKFHSLVFFSWLSSIFPIDFFGIYIRKINLF